MSGLPAIRGVGNMVSTPELRFTQNGTAVCNFQLAFNERKLSNGEWVDGDTTFLRAVAWGVLAENIAESLDKGNRVLVEGQLRPNNFEREDGSIVYGFELRVDDIGPALKFATVKVRKAVGGPGQSDDLDRYEQPASRSARSSRDNSSTSRSPREDSPDSGGSQRPATARRRASSRG